MNLLPINTAVQVISVLRIRDRVLFFTPGSGISLPLHCIRDGNNYLCTYDLYTPVHNVLDAYIISINRASGRVLGLEFKSLMGHGIEPIGECHLGPKKLENSKTQPPPTCPSNGYADMHASKTLCTGLYKSLVHRWFYEHENPLIGLRSPDGDGEGGKSEGEKQGGQAGGGE
jgi:hypothetical protein